MKLRKINPKWKLDRVWRFVTENRILVTFNGTVSTGSVIPTNLSKSWFEARYRVEVRADRKLHDGAYMDGHGLSVGIYSDDLRVIVV